MKIHDYFYLFLFLFLFLLKDICFTEFSCLLSNLNMNQPCEVKSLSRVRLFATPWTVALQAPLSMGFSRQYTGVDCHFLLQGIFPTQGLNLGLSHCRQTLYHVSHQGSRLWRLSSNPDSATYWLYQPGRCRNLYVLPSLVCRIFIEHQLCAGCCV